MCGSGKGGQSSSSSANTTAPPAYLNNAYQSLVSNAQNTASTSYQPYTGQLVSPINGTQNQAISQIGAAQGIQNPYLASATNAAATSQINPWSSTPQYSGDAIANYESPYQSQVVNATEAEINQTNAQQQSQLQGNAVSQGALGGDRSGIAAAALANQQGLAANQTLAQLNNQNFAQAQGEFNTEQQSQLGANEATNWLNSQAANTYGNLGNEALNTSLTGSQALLNAGTLQQQTAQAQDTANYGQYQQAQAYPYQQEDWLSGILTGLGGVAGGTTIGSGTVGQAGASPFSQILGLGETGLGAAGSAGGFSNLFSKNGGVIRVPHYRGGLVGRPRFATGGAPTDYLTDVNIGWIPKPNTKGGHANFPGAFHPSSPTSKSSSMPSIGGLGGTASPSGTNGIDPATGNSTTTQNLINSDFVGSNEPSLLTDAGSTGTPVSGAGGGAGGFLGSADSSANFGNFIDSAGFRSGGRAGLAAGGIFGSLGAARHMAPRINLPKTPDLLKVPKFAVGGEVLPIIGDIAGAFFGDPGAGNQAQMGLDLAEHLDTGGGVGGLAPSAQNANPIVQSQYQRIAAMSPEQLQEMAVRYPSTSPQGALIQRALQQKRAMPATQQQQTSSAAAPTPQTAGVGLQTPQFADGGSPDDDNTPPPAPVSQDVSYGTDPPLSSKYQQLADRTQGRFDQKADPWQSLMVAGLSTLAGGSRNAGQNIGEGALAGFKNYDEQGKQIADKAYKQGTLDDAIDKLDQEADFHKDAVNNQQAQLDLENNKATASQQYQQGLLANDTTKTANEAKYQQGMLDWRNSQIGRGGSAGAVQSLAQRIMDESADENGNPTITFDQALTRAKASGATTTQQAREDGILRKNAVDLYQNRIINDDTGKPYTMTEALQFYGVKPQGSGTPSSGTAPTSTAQTAKNLPPPPPPVGAVIKGWKFLGGDPSKQSNWAQQ